MACGGRTFCTQCGHELIHRDNRQAWEASSSLNQIIHREGPALMTCGDIDTYVEKWRGNTTILRLLEHKQPDQKLGRAQARVLEDIDRMIRHAIAHPSNDLQLSPDSGVFIIRGKISGEDHGKRKVDFAGPQVVDRLDGERVLTPKNRKELFDWINGGPDWTPRNNRGRWWR